MRCHGLRGMWHLGVDDDEWFAVAVRLTAAGLGAAGVDGVSGGGFRVVVGRWGFQMGFEGDWVCQKMEKKKKMKMKEKMEENGPPAAMQLAAGDWYYPPQAKIWLLSLSQTFQWNDKSNKEKEEGAEERRKMED